MNRILFISLLLLTSVVAGPALHAQQTRIAVIDLKAVFDGYYKTKQSDVIVKDRQAEFQKNRTQMLNDYERANQEYKRRTDSANDPAVSAEEQARRRKEAEVKLLEIREIEQSVANLDRQFQADIAEQINRMRQNILRDIQDAVDRRARDAGFNLVLDTASESVNRTPVILFHSGLTDITQPILTQLNQTAPPGSLPTGN